MVLRGTRGHNAKAGEVETANICTKPQIDFTIAAAPPSILPHTTPGAQVWGNQAYLTRTIKARTAYRLSCI